MVAVLFITHLMMAKIDGTLLGGGGSGGLRERGQRKTVPRPFDGSPSLVSGAKALCRCVTYVLSCLLNGR